MGCDRAQVAHTRSAVDSRVGVDQFLPPTITGESEVVVLLRNGRKIGDTNQGVLVIAPANERDRIAGSISTLQPLEASLQWIHGPQLRALLVDPVEISDELLHASMEGLIEQMPLFSNTVTTPMPKIWSTKT